jgi:DNA-binding Lrp family transcriptional regulator
MMDYKKKAEVKLPHVISPADKTILKVLLDPDGRISSHKLAKMTGLPRTTVQRRRKFLERELLSIAYTLNLKSLGFKRVDLLVFTQGGKTISIRKALLKLIPVVYVARAIGEHTIDLKVEAIVKDNAELLNLTEEIKAMEGVRDVVWSETVEVIGVKKSIPSEIIDSL